MPAGFGILARNQLARWFGVAVAAVNLIAALTSIEAYPFRALVIVGIDCHCDLRTRRVRRPARAASVMLGAQAERRTPSCPRDSPHRSARDAAPVRVDCYGLRDAFNDAQIALGAIAQHAQRRRW